MGSDGGGGRDRERGERRKREKERKEMEGDTHIWRFVCVWIEFFYAR